MARLIGAQDITATPQPSISAGIPHPRRTLIQVVAEVTGLEHRTIVRQVAQGSSLAAIIQANSGDVQTVIVQSVTKITAEIITANEANVDNVVNIAVARATEEIHAAVITGRVGQAQADELLAHLYENYSAAVNGEFRGRTQKAIITVAVLRHAANQTGLSVREIIRAIRLGQSLADVLNAHNVDTAALITTAVDTMQTRLHQTVTNGRVTNESAKKPLEQFQQRLTENKDKARGTGSYTRSNRGHLIFTHDVIFQHYIH